MSDSNTTESNISDPENGKPRRRAAGRPAGPPKGDAAVTSGAEGSVESSAKKKSTQAAKKPVKKAATKSAEKSAEKSTKAATVESEKSTTSQTPAKRTSKKAAVTIPVFQAPDVAAVKKAPKAKVAAQASKESDLDSQAEQPIKKATAKSGAKKPASQQSGAKKSTSKSGTSKESTGKETTGKESAGKKTAKSSIADVDEQIEFDGDGGDEAARGSRRRNRRGGRNRNKGRTNGADSLSNESEDEITGEFGESDDSQEGTDTSSPRRRTRNRNRDGSEDDGASTRIDAKRNRRRDGRDNRRRASLVTEAEFLARRENVERNMVVRQKGNRTQIAVLEDGVLVEHYINQSSSGSLIGNVYLGRVQNVLPGMEAAFVDIGKGRNAVLYAGEVNWDSVGLEGQPQRIEMALKTGDTVLVQVTKDPVGQKGARLTSQISMPGRFLVYVPNNPMTGISRKLPDRERSRLKSILRQVVPEDAGVIVRTAAEGASEEELRSDVARLAAQWDDIVAKSQNANAPAILYSEPDISIKVVRDIFNEDVKKLIVSGEDAWDIVEPYVSYVAPELVERLEKHVDNEDVFAKYRIDEQLAKALDRKVFLPSGGSLVIDRTEAMTVVDVNTGKFIGQGGNLEQTVTKNNLEAAEEIVRQLRLRDIGGIIVIDFIDMVLESNRDQVIRRLIECLGRDRTKHQVAEVTSLGLVQMTRKRIGAGLLEVFSHQCDVCNGRGVVISTDAHTHEKSSSTVVSQESGQGQDASEVAGKGAKSSKSRGKKRAAAVSSSAPPPIESLGF